MDRLQESRASWAEKETGRYERVSEGESTGNEGFKAADGITSTPTKKGSEGPPTSPSGTLGGGEGYSPTFT